MRAAGGVAVALVAVTLAGCASGPSDAGFGDVQQAVLARTGQRVVWNRQSPEDAATTAAIGRLLAAELTADAAVQVALLNNRRLQAVFEELGIAQADLVEAGLLQNPVFAGHARFAGNAPAGTNIALSLVQSFLDLVTLPLRRRVA